MSLKICHISDTHGAKFHTRLNIPECDVLIHSGDIGNRTTPYELTEFLEWFKVQSAKVKIWTPGNHDISLDKEWLHRDWNGNSTLQLMAKQAYEDSKKILENYPDIKYLVNRDYVYEGVKFYGSPYTPSFHRRNWVFNRDRGEEIMKEWAKIPSDTNVLITHGPPYGILDVIPDEFREVYNEDTRRGCEDLYKVIHDRLKDLKLHCFGHIHDGPTGVVIKQVTNTRWVTFSNGSVISNFYEFINRNPPIIQL